MAIENINYQFEILEYAVNQYLDELLPCNDRDSLNVIANKSNEIVWKIATEIYKESGHQIDFASIKDLLDLRSNLLENQIAEEIRAKADLDARRLSKKAEKERFRKEKEIANAKAKAKLEAKKSEQSDKQQELDREQREKESKKLQAFKRANPDINSNYETTDIFIRIKNIIANYLEIDGKIIKFNTYIMKDLEADELDNLEIVMAIEEEFDIEISDEDIPSCEYKFMVSRDYSSCLSFGDWNVKKMFYLIVQKI